MRSFKVDINVLALPLFVFFGLIFLSIIAGKIVINNVSSLTQQISDNKGMENQLSAKLTSLKTLNSPQTGDQLKALELDLPEVNPVFEAMSKIQSVGINKDLVIGNFNSSNITSGKDNPVSTSEIDFTAEGTYAGLLAFISTLKDYFPITRFDSIKILNQNSNGISNYKLSAAVSTYWSALPSLLPSIETPVTELTSAEQTQVLKIRSLQAVNLVSTATASATMGKTNPFQ